MGIPKSSSEPWEPFSLLRQMTFIWRRECNGLRIIPRSYCYFGHVMVLKNILLQKNCLEIQKPFVEARIRNGLVRQLTFLTDYFLAPRDNTYEFDITYLQITWATMLAKIFLYE